MPPVDPDEQVEYNGATMAIKDVPDPLVRQLLGLGHPPNGRPIVPGTWRYTPQTCVYTDLTDGNEWIDDGQTLVCTGCGYDGT